MSVCVDVPWEMHISPALHPMKALDVANQGLPRMTGCPFMGSLEEIMRKSTGYSQEATVTMRSSIAPIGLIGVRSASSKIVGVGRRRGPNCSNSIVCQVIMLMAAPKSIRVLPIKVLWIPIVTTGFPGLAYLGTGAFSERKSEIWPTR